MAGSLRVRVPYDTLEWLRYFLEVFEKYWSLSGSGEVSKIKVEPGKLTVYFTGYEEAFPRDARLTVAREISESGKWVTRVTLPDTREARRWLEFYVRELERGQGSRLYSIAREGRGGRGVRRSAGDGRKRHVLWRLTVQRGSGEDQRIWLSLSKVEKRVWEAIQSCGGQMLEDEVLRVITGMGYARIDAERELKYIRDSWVESGWLEVLEV